MSTPQSVFVMLKPVAFERNLVEHILAMLAGEGFTIRHQKIVDHPPKELIAIQYPEEEFIRTNRLFSRQRIIDYCAGGLVMVMVLVGENAISKMKDIKGCPDPKRAKPGTIRSLLDDTIEEADAEKRALRDLIHSSDNETETKHQIEAWFGVTTT